MKHPDDPLTSARLVVLLTGATSGLCAGVAERLAACRYRTIVATRRGGGDSSAVLARVHRYDAEAAAVELDLHDEVATAQGIAAIEAKHGPIYAAVHGRGPMRIARFAEARLADAREMLAENLENAIALAHAVLPGMRARGSGRLIYFGMTGSSVTRPERGLAFYGAAKAGLVAFARTLSLEEAARGITVNVIEPGDIREKNRSRAEAWAAPAGNPSGHAGSWEDIADVVAFLLSREAGFMNGGIMSVGGGLIGAAQER